MSGLKLSPRPRAALTVASCLPCVLGHNRILLASRDTFETSLRTLGYDFHGAEGNFPLRLGGNYPLPHGTCSPAHQVSRPTGSLSNSTFTDTMLVACHWPWWEHLHHGNR